MGEEASAAFNEQSRQLVDDLSVRLDQDTMLLSGGYERLPDFQEIVSHGEDALSVLLANIEHQTAATGDWWRLQAVWTIAAQTGRPIDFAEDIRGKYEEVKKRCIKWGQEQGYLEESIWHE